MTVPLKTCYKCNQTKENFYFTKRKVVSLCKDCYKKGSGNKELEKLRKSLPGNHWKDSDFQWSK